MNRKGAELFRMPLGSLGSLDCHWNSPTMAQSGHPSWLVRFVSQEKSLCSYFLSSLFFGRSMLPALPVCGFSIIQ